MSGVKRLQAWRSVDLAFLAMAVLVHAALLLVPLKKWENRQADAPPRLKVDLRQLLPPAPAEPRTEPESEPQTETLPTEPTPPEPAELQRRTARTTLNELPEPPPESIEEPEPQTFNAQQLRELVRRAELKEDATSPARQLGSAKPWQPPANWNRNAGAPYLADSENRFNGMTVPEDVEIVDRWLASDGSHNVVVNLPNGDTVCGRAEPFNPMQPLVEPVMMFRPCGGGGKRTFSMPDRYKKGQ